VLFTAPPNLTQM